MINLYGITSLELAEAVKEHGSNRAAARAMGIPESTLRSRLKKEKECTPPEHFTQSEPRILIYDVERSKTQITKEIYDLKQYSNYENHKNITREWVLFGASWMFLGDKTPEVVSIKPGAPFDDYGVVTELHNALSSADILVGHNSDRFDYKTFNTRAIYYGLSPVAPKQFVDTLKLAKKYFYFTSNSLSYVANYLGVGMKDEAPDWDKVHEGCPQEIRYMRRYNKQDVLVTKNVYLKMRNWDKGHPNHNVYTNGIHHSQCKICGSDNLELYPDYHYTKAGKYELYQCRDCGGYSQGKKNLKKVDLR